MSFALKTKQIRCPNCNYEGKAKIKDVGGGPVIILLILFFISLFFWPFFIITGIMFLAMIFMPAKQICPKCKFANPVPVNNQRS